MPKPRRTPKDATGWGALDIRAIGCYEEPQQLPQPKTAQPVRKTKMKRRRLPEILLSGAVP